jgi:hypothetical protein
MAARGSFKAKSIAASLCLLSARPLPLPRGVSRRTTTPSRGRSRLADKYNTRSICWDGLAQEAVDDAVLVEGHVIPERYAISEKVVLRVRAASFQQYANSPTG